MPPTNVISQEIGNGLNLWFGPFRFGFGAFGLSGGLVVAGGVEGEEVASLGAWCLDPDAPPRHPCSAGAWGAADAGDGAAIEREASGRDVLEPEDGVA